MLRKKAQSIAEYVLILSIVGLALGAMNTYFQRGIKAAVKVVADGIGDQEKALEVDPDKITTSESKVRRSQVSNITQTYNEPGKTETVSIEKEESNVLDLGKDELGNPIHSYNKQITLEDR